MVESINLNLIPSVFPTEMVNVSQDDINRIVRCNLFDGDKPFVLTSSHSVVLKVLTPDFKILQMNITNTLNSYVNIPIIPSLSAVSGIAYCKLHIVTSTTDISCGMFYINIETKPRIGPNDIDFLPLSYDGETHYIQNNRNISINANKISSVCWSYGYCVGIINIPTVGFDENYFIIMQYNMQYLSVGRDDYWPLSACFSDSLQTNVETYGDTSIPMEMEVITSSGAPASDKLLSVVQVPAANKYFHIQFGINSPINMKMYYAFAPGKTYEEVLEAAEAFFN